MRPVQMHVVGALSMLSLFNSIPFLVPKVLHKRWGSSQKQCYYMSCCYSVLGIHSPLDGFGHA